MSRPRKEGKKTIGALIQLTPSNHAKAIQAKNEVNGSISDGINYLLNKFKEVKKVELKNDSN